MDKPVQWMTLAELRDELEQTQPAPACDQDLDRFPARGQLPAQADAYRRHHLVSDELMRRPGND